jgi:uncharacterized protein involved in outer membrane biogenesis
MTRPIRWILRIAAALFVLAVAAVVAFFLLLDTIVRGVLVARMHAATGMGVKINSVHIGLRSATFTIEGLKLYNTPAFGSALCLDMPELHVEYDRAAARTGMIHLPLVRLNLAQINVVEDKKGHSNFDSIETQNSHSSTNTTFLDNTNFSGIDTLNLSLGKLHVTDLRSGQEEEVDFGVTNQILHNVKSDADLEGVAVLLAMHGSSTKQHSNIDLTELLKMLTGH